MFFDKFYDNFPDQKYPLLIGVMRLFERKTNGSITSQYQFRNLVQDDDMRYDRLTINQENLLPQLKVFKEKCHENERNPVSISFYIYLRKKFPTFQIFSFVEKTRLSWEILVEIAGYLSLNDAINAFSIDILPLLDLPQAKFHLSNPSGLFIKKILPKIKPDKIVSLEFRSKWLSTEHLSSASTKLISVTCYDLQNLSLRRDYIRCFPNWTRLCFYYDHETNYVVLENILYEFQRQLKRFEIHCPGLYVSYNDIDPPKDIEKKMIMVEYLLLDISLQSSRPMYGFLDSYQRRYFGAEMKLMKTMPNIRYLHLIVRNDDIERVCYFTIWQLIALTFSKLKKIQIDVRGTTFEQRESLMNRALTLQTEISAHRESFKFKIRPL